MELLLVFLTILFWGTAPLFEKIALRHGDPLVGTIIRGLTVGILMIPLLFMNGKLKAMAALPPKSILFFVISGLFAGVLGAFTYFAALKGGATSKIVPLSAAYPLVTVILSMALLGESVTAARAAGIILIVTGIFLVQ